MTLAEYKCQDDPKMNPTVILKLSDFKGDDNSIDVQSGCTVFELAFEDLIGPVKYLYTLEHGKYRLKTSSDQNSVFFINGLVRDHILKQLNQEL